MRKAVIALAALVIACAGAPPPAPESPRAVAPEQPPEPSKPPPPEPLAVENVELTLKSEFVGLGLGRVRPKLWTDDELSARLPAAAKSQFEAVARARKAARDAERAQTRATSAHFACDGCRALASLEHKREEARRAAARARGALAKAKEGAERALDKQLGSPKAVAEIGIALARIQRRGTATGVEDELGFAVEYGALWPALPGREALERAATLAGPEQEAGQHVRHELLGHLAKGEADSVRRVIGELLTAGPRQWRSELQLRLALLDAVAGDADKAAARFEQALADHEPGSAVTRRALALGVLVARYRALDFERALSATSRAFEELARPEPVAPAAPPPPQRKPAAKPSKAPSARLARRAALAEAAEFGMLGLLSSSSWSSNMAEAAVTRFGADCVERLNRDPGTLDGPLEGRAAILSLLAARALYRNDLESAKRHAEAARALGALGATRQAVDVLRVLALRQGDGSRAEALEREKSKLPWNDYAFAHRGEPDSKALDQELSEAQAKNKPDKPDKPDEPDKPDKPEPPAARNVHSALRACIEPVRERLPKATGTGAEKRIATITLHAKVFEDGHAELEVGADREDEGMAQVLECLKSDGPRMLARAPSSVSAKIVLDESVRRAQAETWGLFGTLGDSFGVEGLGGLSGADIGEAYGVGGLGLVGTGRGGGGTGEGIGLGSVGVIGHGSGTGSGYGRGSGRLGGRKTKQKPPPKAKPAPKK